MKDIILTVNKHTGEVYEYQGARRFQNLNTGAEGEISPELGKKNLILSLELNSFANRNPVLIDLIQEYDMTVDLKSVKK